ncbi:hypothetical protein SH528x_006660 [Novipirellula sp. SH528]|uniref:hypothetical protein n=1 Tax=Novipirellula sp. SH528 TaxID=3454466 RepID=UPI003F9F0EBE
MPYLMVNLDDTNDCRKAIKQLRSAINAPDCDRDANDNAGRRGRQGNRLAADAGGPGKPQGEDVAALPLPMKLRRIKQRHIWKHLVRIANAAEDAQSLPELDLLLDLPKNKMRSLKAIMAKLENRFDLKFLRVVPNAGVDASGNPRYEMLPNVRRQILKIEAA